jgi:ring-1,2-phenylacetyl-CoA epoxidase subunit PaaE
MFHALRIGEVRRETAECVSLVFDVPAELRARFGFVPGQYLTLRRVVDGEEIRRSYSICSAPGDGELRVAIKRVAGGAFSEFANAGLAAGDTMEAMAPEGRFGAPVGEGTYLAIAAGSGITPVMSVLRSVLAGTKGARFVLLYGSRTVEDIIFRGALEDLKDRHLDRLTVIHVLSREAQDVPMLSGRLDADRLLALLPATLDPAGIDHALLCGPGGMIDTAAGVLGELGVAPERIHVERFTPAPGARARRAIVPEVAAPFATATVIYDGKTNTVPVAEGEPVLEAALRAGLDLPWACRGGMCSSCRARLTEGSVTLAENFSLEPWELEAGYVLACQAHPTTARVTIDFDHV